MIYEYTCPSGHVSTRLRPIADRKEPCTCDTCGDQAEFVLSVPAKRTDGIYSYAENVGDPHLAERLAAGEPHEGIDG